MVDNPLITTIPSSTFQSSIPDQTPGSTSTKKTAKTYSSLESINSSAHFSPFRLMTSFDILAFNNRSLSLTVDGPAAALDSLVATDNRTGFEYASGSDGSDMIEK
jgi:hypothetical protein